MNVMFPATSSAAWINVEIISSSILHENNKEKKLKLPEREANVKSD